VTISFSRRNLPHGVGSKLVWSDNGAMRWQDVQQGPSNVQSLYAHQKYQATLQINF